MRSPRNGPVIGMLTAWLVLALAAGASGRMASLRPPAPQLVLAALTIALIVLERQAGWLRAWVAAVDVRVLVGLHLTRFVGIAFLLLGQRGELPAAFAVPAGWGDLVVASLAGLLLLGGVAPGGGGRRLYQVWNGLGVLDLVFVVLTATRLSLADPESMRALFRMPLSLVPTFLVPLLLASHLWIWRRLSARNAE
jgi:hypothetical protein